MNIKRIFATVAVLAALAFEASAQTSTVTNQSGGTTTTTGPVMGSITNLPSFFSEVETWATSFNTDPTVAWTNAALNGNIEISDGISQQTGGPMKDYLKGQYDIGSWSVGGEVAFDGVGSGISGGEAIGGYALAVINDFKMELNIGAGYGTDNQGKNTEVIDPGLNFKKKIVRNTFGEAGIYEPIYFKGKFDSIPTFRIGAGFEF